jgi:hypothetical protein
MRLPPVGPEKTPNPQPTGFEEHPGPDLNPSLQSTSKFVDQTPDCLQVAEGEEEEEERQPN